MDKNLLEVNFDGVNEFSNYFSQRLSNYKEEVNSIVAILNSYEGVIDSRDAEAFQLRGYTNNLKSFSDVLNDNKDMILKVSTLISGYLKDSLELYIKTFLDRGMIYEAFKEPTSSCYEGKSVKEIFKPKKLKLSYNNGEISSNLSEEDIKRILEEMDKRPAIVNMDQEAFLKLLEAGGFINNDNLTKLTLDGAAFDAIKKLLESKGLTLEILKNGEIAIKGTPFAIESVFGKNINITSPSELFKSMLGKTWDDMFEALSFKSVGGINKLNSALIWLNYLNNVDDAYINYKITGDVIDTGVGLVVDAGATTCSIVVGGIVTGTIVSVFSIGTGGAVVVAVIVGGAVAYVFNAISGEIKEVVLDGIDSVEDFIRNISEFTVNY